MKSCLLNICSIWMTLATTCVWAQGPDARMNAVSRVPLRQAEQHLNRGMELASRGAVHSAASAFEKALSLVASAADVRTGGQQHITAMTDGLEAMDEADDFLFPGSVTNVGQTMTRLIAGHQTPVFAKSEEVPSINPLTAMQEYYFYARDRLADAGAHEPVASYALYGLGRLQPYLTHEDSLPNPLLEAKMLAYYRAAIRVWPQNNRAANEVGVLLARIGELDAAEQAFRHSYAIAAQPEVWQNLQKVQTLRRQPGTDRNFVMRPTSPQSELRVESAIEWVDPMAFRTRSQPLTVPANKLPQTSSPSTR